MDKLAFGKILKSRNALDKLYNEKLILRSTIMSHIKQIAIANLQGNY